MTGQHPNAPQSSQRGGTSASHCASILVVDDSESKRYSIVRHLRQAGYPVQEAHTVTAASKIIRENPPDLVVLDVGLPDGSGLDLARWLRTESTTKLIPIVQVSATFVRGEDFARGLDSGADSYLVEPIDPHVLLATVRSLLRARAAEAGRAHLAAIVENADEPILSKDLDGTITSWNSAAQRLFGYTSAEAIGRPISLIMPPECKEEEQRISEQVVQGKAVERLETVRVDRDGHRIDVLITISPIRDEAGRIAGASKIIRDITRRKRAERALRESEARLKTIIENLHEGLVVVNAQGTTLRWNRMALEMHGYSASEDQTMLAVFADLVGSYEITTLEGAAVPLEEWPVPRLLREGSLANYELSVRRKDQSWQRLLSYRGVVLAATAEHESMGLLTIRDVTDRRHSEQALRRQAALIDLTPTAMLVTTTDRHITFWNKGAESLYGWTREQAVGRRSYELLKTEFPEPFERILSQLHETGRWNGEIIHWARDGRRLVIQSAWQAQRDSKGELTEILQSNVDVTERKHLQEGLEKLVAERTARLRETVGDLEHFSYTITHDMRAPLRAMQAFGQMLSMDYQDRLDDAGRDYLQRIVVSSQRMDHLITDALSYAKIVRQEMDIYPVDVHALLRGMLRSYPEFQLPKADVRIEGGIPLVIGNKAGLTQCFSNLLGNAVKFVNPGTQPRVRIWGELRGEWVRIWVEDNGIGISKEGQTKLFTMFHRLSSDHEGTGIGLALVQKVVERMRGRVGVESDFGKGSRFWVELQHCPDNGLEI